MAFLSCEEMLAAARSQKITLAEAVLRSDLDESRLTEEQSRAAMHHLWQASNTPYRTMFQCMPSCTVPKVAAIFETSTNISPT